MKSTSLGWISILGFSLGACSPLTGTVQTSTSVPNTDKQFVSGVKAVRVNLGNSTTIGAGVPLGSFVDPIVAPTPTLVPAGYPGSGGSASYQPGVSATSYYDVDGATVITKPSWIRDIQIGYTGLPSSNTCARIGGATENDGKFFYRVSEVDCTSAEDGLGTSLDKVFIRVVLDRDTAYFGTKENLLIQVEYQSTGLRQNADGTSVNPEDNLDQLWKVFWSSSLSGAVALTPFSVFIPPNYSAHCIVGSGNAGAGCGSATATATPYSPRVTRQILIPLSAYPNQSVIQLSRVKGRVGSDAAYVSSFCTAGNGQDHNSPSCLGVIFHSLTLIRM